MTLTRILHPVFGLDEDWNGFFVQPQEHSFLLHPVFGLDEDWNSFGTIRFLHASTLHPVFGLDEDWNRGLHALYAPTKAIASSLRAGGGLEPLAMPIREVIDLALHPVFGLDEDWNDILEEQHGKISGLI